MTSSLGGQAWPVDTGFMVFNPGTYPNFIRLLDHLGVSSRASDMSFSVRCRRCRVEYLERRTARPVRPAGGGWPAGRTGECSPTSSASSTWARRALASGTADTRSLGEFLERGRFGAGLIRHFVLPMGARDLVGARRGHPPVPGRLVPALSRQPRPAAGHRPAGLAHDRRRQFALRGGAGRTPRRRRPGLDADPDGGPRRHRGHRRLRRRAPRIASIAS